ncbi:MAG: cell division protein SepF [Actinomycetota bacterium]
MAGFFRRALIYLGLVEDDEFEEMLEYDEGRADYVEPPPPPPSRRAQREEARVAPIQAVPNKQVRMHMVEPKSFNDAEQIGQKFKSDIPVIINLQQADAELSKRLIDFASGLTYGLEGGIQRVAEKVFLLSPHNVEVSAEDKRWLREKGFFNQF